MWQEEGPRFSSCIDPPTLEDHLANIATAPNTAVVLEEVSAELNSSLCELTSTDIPTLVNFLSDASARQQEEIEAAPPKDRAEISERFWRASVRTADLLVSKPEPWLGLQEEEVEEQVDKWQEQVDRAARTMGEHLDPEMATKLSSKGAGGIKLELVLITEEEEEEEQLSFTGDGAQLILTHEQKEKEERNSNPTEKRNKNHHKNRKHLKEKNRKNEKRKERKK